MPYTPIPTPSPLSTLVSLLAAQDEQIRSFERSVIAAGPTLTPVGLVHNATNYSGSGYTGSGEVWRRWNGTTFTLLQDLDFPQINAGGTVAMAADLPMGGYKITGLVAGSASGHAVEYDQLAAAIAAWTQDVDADSHELTNLGAPTDQQSAARLDDTWQATHAMGQQLAGFQMTDVATESTTYQQILGGKNTDFAPRRVHLMFAGALTPTAGGGSAGTMPQTEFTGMLWDADTSWKTIGTFSLSGLNYDVKIKRKTTSPRGVWVGIFKQIGGDSYEPATREIYAEFAVSQ